MDVTGFGICRLSVVPVRKEPAHGSEQVTQLLFGDHYELTGNAKDGKWLAIKGHADGYAGWIDSRQHQAISEAYFGHINDTEFKITTDVVSTMLYNKGPHTILIGSIIPISSAELFKMEEQFAFNGEAKNLGQKREFEFLRTVVSKYLNAPYQWGGKSPFGIDCSGLVQMAFKICGYPLHRDAWQQATQGRPVASFAAARPGDLAFFDEGSGKITHTGILVAPDRIIHASGKVRIDPIDEKGIRPSDGVAYTHQLAHLRRVLAET